MITCTKRLEWDAAHRVLGHGGRCRFIHGHRYAAEITVRADGLDRLGMVLDFSCIKDRVGKWIDDNLDHNLILHRDDPLLKVWADYVHGMENRRDETVAWQEAVFGGRSPFVMDDNPTAENLARLIAVNAAYLLSDLPVQVVSVRLWETPSSYADFFADK